MSEEKGDRREMERKEKVGGREIVSKITTEKRKQRESKVHILRRCTALTRSSAAAGSSPSSRALLASSLSLSSSR